MYDELKCILINDIGLAAEDIRPEATLADAGMDSLAMVELSLVLDKRFDIAISDDELIETATVAEISELVAERASALLPQPTG